MSKHTPKVWLQITPLTAAADATCPPATQDIAINLENRKNAIDTAMYGPLNPAEPNEEYWTALGAEWSVDVETAKKQRCGNCAVFIQTPEMLSCIEGGLTENADEFDAIDEAGELGYCEAFDFKCASARTCRAWVAGGPVTEEKTEEPVVEVVEEPVSVTKAYQVNFGVRAEAALQKKVDQYNKYAASDRKATFAMVKAVYRRGASSFSVAQHQGTTRSKWAMTRVDAFLRLLSAGRPSTSSYKADNDLLPVSHPRSTKRSEAVVASAHDNAEQELTLSVEENYETPEYAILALTELSGLGYEAEPAIRASWLRAVRNNENPFKRASMLATMKYDSLDADLLPKGDI